jgi:hypothetical protein
MADDRTDDRRLSNDRSPAPGAHPSRDRNLRRALTTPHLHPPSGHTWDPNGIDHAVRLAPRLRWIRPFHQTHSRRGSPLGKRDQHRSESEKFWAGGAATATTLPSRPRAPVTGHTTRHHGMYRWNPSPDARECAPSHRRRPGAARSFRPQPRLSGGPFHSREDSRSRKHLAADPWTPPPSRLRSASIG